jgi:hypothetical protein
MDRLLGLPVELRLQIYKHIYCDYLEIDVDEYWGDRDPKYWAQFAEPLTKIDTPLASDIKALHWSRMTVVYSEHMRHSISTSDQKFVYWLFDHANDVKNVLGYLRFESKRSSIFHWRCTRDCHDTCVQSLTINFCNGELCIVNDKDQICTCEHAPKARLLMMAVLEKIPRGRGRLQPRLSDLWDLYEAWRLRYTSSRAPWPRLWRNVSLDYSVCFRCPEDPRAKLVSIKGKRNDLWDLQQILGLEIVDNWLLSRIAF